MDLVRQVRADREIASAIERDGRLALRNTTSFSAFPMFVPSLSWQNNPFSINGTKEVVFLTQRALRAAFIKQ